MTDNNHSNAAMKIADKITEQPSRYAQLDKMSASEILYAINEEDHLVAEAVRKAIPQILNLIEKVENRMKNGGRVFYIGAGTSGRLGVLDASELPPTFGVSTDLVTGIIAGGDALVHHQTQVAYDTGIPGIDAFKGGKTGGSHLHRPAAQHDLAVESQEYTAVTAAVTPQERPATVARGVVSFWVMKNARRQVKVNRIVVAQLVTRTFLEQHSFSRSFCF